MKAPRDLSTVILPPALELDQCLAKTVQGTDERVLPGIDVLTHCHIVGEVARQLVARQPAWLRAVFFPPGSELVAAAHDVGKVSPTFQKRLHENVGTTLSGFEDVCPAQEEGWGYHAGVSQAATQNLGAHISGIVGRHHGKSHSLGLYNALSEVFGGPAWQKRREELLEALKERLESDWPTVADDTQATVLSGLTTVADWIGSGQLFERPGSDWKPLVTQALDRAGFFPLKVRPKMSFYEIFSFDAKATQKGLFEACRQPGVYVLEAPMGLGKTEAALYAAYQALEADRATGIYFALPTQLTSNKIHERMNKFLGKILDPSQPLQKSLLVHGNAQLLKDFELGEEGQPGHSWFQANKRGLLAPVAVGTVDQALMAVMNVKHGFVRAFGLAGKVVILDEVHSYDSYTGTILDFLVKSLVKMHCTVIILSATLTQERRRVLIGEQNLTEATSAYPLVTARSRYGETTLRETEAIPSVSVALRFVEESAQAEDEALARAEAGQQVLWVENTVAEAQERYKTLAARASGCGVECGLLHSRFLKTDRQTNETYWVGLYGPDGKSSRSQRGRILVGTQVVEQSLDIDADFLVTKLCPTDMLFQRLGRLWRHEHSRPEEARREAWILGASYEQTLAEPERLLGKSAFVYAPYVLLRTLNVWQNLASVQIPGQMRELLENTYAERIEEGVLARFKQELATKRQKLRNLALVSLSQTGATLEESAATRYSETDTTEVLLVKAFRKREGEIVLTFTDDKSLTLPQSAWKKGLPEWRAAAVALMMHTVTVSARVAPGVFSESALAWLKPYVFLDNNFRVALVNNDGSVQAFLQDSSGQNEAHYDVKIGYQTPQKEEFSWKNR